MQKYLWRFLPLRGLKAPSLIYNFFESIKNENKSKFHSFGKSFSLLGCGNGIFCKEESKYKGGHVV